MRLNVLHGDPAAAPRPLDVREINTEFVGQAKRGIGGVVLLRSPLLPTLAELAQLPGGRKAEVSCLVRGGFPNLACSGLYDYLRETSRRRRAGHPTLRLTIRLALCRPAVLAAALPRLSSSTEWKRLLDAADRLPGTLTELSERLTRAADELIEVACRLARALTDISHGLSRALTDISDRLAGPLANITHRLASALADVTDRLACALADILERPFCPLANVLRGVTGFVDRLTRALADLGDRPT